VHRITVHEQLGGSGTMETYVSAEAPLTTARCVHLQRSHHACFPHVGLRPLTLTKNEETPHTWLSRSV
jgi:hypothetical protein